MEADFGDWTFGVLSAQVGVIVPMFGKQCC